MAKTGGKLLIKYRDPVAASFSSKDIVLNVQTGTIFYKRNRRLFALRGTPDDFNLVVFPGQSTNMQILFNDNGIMEGSDEFVFKQASATCGCRNTFNVGRETLTNFSGSVRIGEHLPSTCGLINNPPTSHEALRVFGNLHVTESISGALSQFSGSGGHITASGNIYTYSDVYLDQYLFHRNDLDTHINFTPTSSLPFTIHLAASGSNIATVTKDRFTVNSPHDLYIPGTDTAPSTGTSVLVLNNANGRVYKTGSFGGEITFRGTGHRNGNSFITGSLTLSTALTASHVSVSGLVSGSKLYLANTPEYAPAAASFSVLTIRNGNVYFTSSNALGGSGGTGTDITVTDESSTIGVTAAESFNFVGNAVTAGASGQNVTVTINAITKSLWYDGQPNYISSSNNVLIDKNLGVGEWKGSHNNLRHNIHISSSNLSSSIGFTNSNHIHWSMGVSESTDNIFHILDHGTSNTTTGTQVLKIYGTGSGNLLSAPEAISIHSGLRTGGATPNPTFIGATDSNTPSIMIDPVGTGSLAKLHINTMGTDDGLLYNGLCVGPYYDPSVFTNQRTGSGIFIHIGEIQPGDQEDPDVPRITGKTERGDDWGSVNSRGLLITAETDRSGSYPGSDPTFGNAIGRSNIMEFKVKDVARRAYSASIANPANSGTSSFTLGGSPVSQSMHQVYGTGKEFIIGMETVPRISTNRDANYLYSFKNDQMPLMSMEASGKVGIGNFESAVGANLSPKAMLDISAKSGSDADIFLNSGYTANTIPLIKLEVNQFGLEGISGASTRLYNPMNFRGEFYLHTDHASGTFYENQKLQSVVIESKGKQEGLAGQTYPFNIRGATKNNFQANNIQLVVGGDNSPNRDSSITSSHIIANLFPSFSTNNGRAALTVEGISDFRRFGEVGIGLSTPSSSLHVTKSVQADNFRTSNPVDIKRANHSITMYYGSNQVTGSSTKFLKDFKVGDSIKITGRSIIATPVYTYQITSSATTASVHPAVDAPAGKAQQLALNDLILISSGATAPQHTGTYHTVIAGALTQNSGSDSVQDSRIFFKPSYSGATTESADMVHRINPHYYQIATVTGINSDISMSISQDWEGNSWTGSTGFNEKILFQIKTADYNPRFQVDASGSISASGFIFASASMASPTLNDTRVVVWDINSNRFYHTGSYGGGAADTFKLTGQRNGDSAITGSLELSGSGDILLDIKGRAKLGNNLVNKHNITGSIQMMHTTMSLFSGSGRFGFGIDKPGTLNFSNTSPHRIQVFNKDTNNVGIHVVNLETASAYIAGGGVIGANTLTAMGPRASLTVAALSSKNSYGYGGTKGIGSGFISYHSDTFEGNTSGTDLGDGGDTDSEGIRLLQEVMHIGTAGSPQGSINIHARGTAGQQIRFFTGGDDARNTGGVNKETLRMTIKDNGGVGIGTHNPQRRLHISNSLGFGNSVPIARFETLPQTLNNTIFNTTMVDSLGDLYQTSKFNTTAGVPTITSSLGINIIGSINTNITASLNISASGYLAAQNITASGNISASGNVIANQITASQHISGGGELYFSSSLNDDSSLKVLTYDTSTGKIYHTGSYLVGGSGGSGLLQSVDDTVGQTGIDQTLSAGGELTAVVSGLTTTSDVTFNNITASNNINAAGYISASGKIYLNTTSLVGGKVLNWNPDDGQIHHVNGILSSSNQIAAEISGAFAQVSASLSANTFKSTGQRNGDSAITGSFEVTSNITGSSDIFLSTVGGHIYKKANDTKNVVRTTRTDNSQEGLFRTDGWGNFTFNNGVGIGYDTDGNLGSTTAGDDLYVKGDVGIGTATPGEELEVVGNISASGTIEGQTLIADVFLSAPSASITNLVNTNITSSGNISASGKFIGAEISASNAFSGLTLKGNITASGNISASGDIHAGLVKASTANTIFYNEGTGLFTYDVSTSAAAAGTLSSSAQIASDISGSWQGQNFISASQVTENLPPNTLSSSAQISADISGALSVTSLDGLGLTLLSSSQQIEDYDNFLLNTTDTLTGVLSIDSANANEGGEIYLDHGSSWTTGYHLDVFKDRFRIFSDVGGSTDQIFTLSGSNVGIGTTIPREKLEVIGNISASGNVIANQITASQHISGGGELYFSSSLNDDSSLKVLTYDTSTGKIYHTGSYSGGGGSSLITSINDTINQTGIDLAVNSGVLTATVVGLTETSNVQFNNLNIDGTFDFADTGTFNDDITIVSNKKIIFDNNQNYIYADVNDLYIGANDDIILQADDDVKIQVGVTEYARFDGANKRLGIGTSAPSQKLTVAGNISASGNIYLGNVGSESSLIFGGQTGDSAKIQTKHNGSQTELIIQVTDDSNDNIRIQTNGWNNSNSGSIYFASEDINIYGRATTGQYVKFDGENARLGIGITTPGEKLEVIGNISASGNVTAYNITSSNNISASGTILAHTGQFYAGGIISNGRIHTNSHITASGNISASGYIWAGGSITSSNSISASGTLFASSSKGNFDIATYDPSTGRFYHTSSLGFASSLNTFKATGQRSGSAGITGSLLITSNTANLSIDSDIPSFINLTRPNTNNVNIQYTNTNGSIYAGIDGIGGNNHFIIGTGQDLSSDPLLTVLDTGNVGINKLNPSKTLTVEGEISASGVIYADRYKAHGFDLGDYNGVSIILGDSSKPMTLRGIGTTINNGNLTLNHASDGHITASGNISASGTIEGQTLIADVFLSAPSASITNLVNTNITSSGNISASGTLNAGLSSATQTNITYYDTDSGLFTYGLATDLVNANTFNTANFAVSSGDVTIKNGGVANVELVNSTISGKALGTNLATIGPGTGMSFSTYNGSTNRTVAINYSNTANFIQACPNTLPEAFANGDTFLVSNVSNQYNNVNKVTGTVLKTWIQGFTTNNAAGMTDFLIQGNTGGTQTIVDGDAISIFGGTGFVTTTAATDKITITYKSSDLTEITDSTTLINTDEILVMDLSTDTNVPQRINFEHLTLAQLSGLDVVNKVRFTLSGNVGNTVDIDDNGSPGGGTANFILNVVNGISTLGDDSDPGGSAKISLFCNGVYEGNYQILAGNTHNVGEVGNLEVDGDVIAYASSDKRLKDNIIPIGSPLKKLLQISGYTFDWNEKQNTYSGHDIGVIAQEVEKVLPEVVETRKNGYKAVKYEKIVPLLIESIKEQQKQIDELKELVTKLTNK